MAPTEGAAGAGRRPVLDISDLSKTFPGTRALDNVAFDLYPGEVHALVGQNGSGKSTMIKILAGFHQPDDGARIELAGEEVTIHDTATSRDLGFRFVHQELGLVDELDTVENLALGEGYETGFGGRIRWRAARREARERIQALGYDFDVRRPVRELAASERTGIAIARALHDWESAKVLVVDEPTASLPSHEVAVLFEAIDRVRAKGLGVIYISHRLDEIFALADRVTLLRDGRVVGTYGTGELDEKKLVSLMVGGVELSPRIPRDPTVESKPVLEVKGLCGEIVEDLSFTANSGEVLGIAGLTGSGREEVLRLLFGDLPRTGEVTIEGRPVRPERPTEAVAAGIALVPADRTGSGSIIGLSVRENTTLTDLARHSHAVGRLSKKEELAETREWIEALDIRPPYPEAVFDSLSGGNQQKVVLAKWLRLKPRAILLDEPTQGVDVGAKATIHALARKAAAEGATVVVASSEDAEICDICDRAIIMRNGQIAGQIEVESMTPETIAEMQLGTVSTVG
ncbi:MAG TPA: sugar ABC transporter ATP-binding protein [Solirubrobacterales bacterium]|nr:sugar ABC transporter ATP-binding protein [Solirubrobacterales bacterium]